MIDVCICTHNPNQELFLIILQALANQTLDKSQYQVWVIDNASDPPIEMSDLTVLTTAGITCKLLLAPRLGLIYARNVAIDVTTSDWVVFVDDDNELSPNYLETAIEIAKKHPEIGCFGGKLLLDNKIKYPSWMQVMLPYLGIKDLGDEVLSKCVNYWGDWEPPGAGFVIHRSVLKLFQHRLAILPDTCVLGRQGQSLLSGRTGPAHSGRSHRLFRGARP